MRLFSVTVIYWGRFSVFYRYKPPRRFSYLICYTRHRSSIIVSTDIALKLFHKFIKITCSRNCSVWISRCTFDIFNFVLKILFMRRTIFFPFESGHYKCLLGVGGEGNAYVIITYYTELSINMLYFNGGRTDDWSLNTNFLLYIHYDIVSWRVMCKP